MAELASGEWYQGPERRAPVDTGPGIQAWRYVGALLVALPLAATEVLSGGTFDPSVVLPAMQTASLVLAAVVAGTAAAHWRATGRAHGLHVAVAATLLCLQAGTHLLASARPETTVLSALDVALCLTAAAWVGRAVLGPEVDTRLRLVPELAGAFLATGILTVVASAIGSTPRWGLVSATLLCVAWFGVGVVGLLRSIAHGWGLLGWASWAAVAIGISELAHVTLGATGLGHLVGAAMVTAALLVAAIGGGAVLAAVAITRRGDLYGMVLDSRRRTADAVDERSEFVHEVRNAVLVIEGAASTLERLGDQLEVDQRRRVEQALRRGIADLRELVASPQAVPDETVALDDLVRERVMAAEMRGLRVVVAASARVEVVGRATLVGRAIDNLLVNAERHGGAGGSEHPIRVVVVREGDRGLVRVEDDGPGVPPEEREAIFRSGHQVDPDRPGDGIGLHVARSVLRAQHGDVTYEAGYPSGACFVVSLPLAARLLEPVGGPVADELHDGR